VSGGARNAVYSQQRDLDRAREIVERGLILRTTVGSVVHGLHNPGTATATRWGCASSRRSTCSGSIASSTSSTARSPRASSGPGDLDLTVYGLRKFCRLALKGSPPRSFRCSSTARTWSPAPRPARSCGRSRPRPSLAARAAFLGYLDAQRQGLLGARHAPRTRELSGENGYDTKYAMHALRIGYQGHRAAGRPGGSRCRSASRREPLCV